MRGSRASPHLTLHRAGRRRLLQDAASALRELQHGWGAGGGQG